MVANFDYYNRFEQPIISLRTPNNDFMGFVDNVKNLNTKPEFNAVWEMTCDVYKYGSDNVELKIYDNIQVKRQFFIEEVGYFIITEVVEHDSNEGKYKSLTLLSCEHELVNKKLTYFNGTYKFYGSSTDSNGNTQKGLMEQILDSLPRWSIGHVDTVVAEKHRTFEEPDTTIYAFLMEDVEESYECIFDFDILNRVINVYDKNNYINKTTILLSRKDIIDGVSITTRSEEIYTALSLYGDDEITYRDINPLGTTTVYNFNYYKSWMSEGLKIALEQWETNVTNAETIIAGLRTDRYNKADELQIIIGEIASIDEGISLLEKQTGVDILDATKVAEINAQIAIKKAEKATKETALNKKQQDIDEIDNLLNDINLTCSFKNNFTEEQLQELDAYINEGTEVEDTLAFTEDMTHKEQEDILRQLYDKAKNMLLDISVPTEELSVDSKGFVFQKEFLPYTSQLSTGSIIDIEIADDIIVSYVLLGMDINYEDKSISLTFGNKYRSSNAERLWSNWESKVSKSATTLTYERSKYGKAVNSGSLDKMNNFMQSSLDLTLNQVKASDGQSLEITDSGVKARRVNPATGEVDPNQLWITSNNIVFTKNNWNNIETAIGRLILPNGEEGYGINAKYIIGDLILGKDIIASGTIEGATLKGAHIESTSGKIGEWIIKNNYLKTDYLHPDDNYMRRVYLQTFLDQYKDKTWIFSIQKAIQIGENPATFDPLWYVDGTGYMYSANEIKSGSNISADGILNIKGTEISYIEGKLHVNDDIWNSGVTLFNETGNIEANGIIKMKGTGTNSFTGKLHSSTDIYNPGVTLFAETGNISANGTLQIKGTGENVYSYFSGRLSVGVTGYSNNHILYVVGNSNFKGSIEASGGFIGNASSATTLSGLTATVAELNYVDGVTSNIQTQLNGKAPSEHTHSYLPLSGGTLTGATILNNNVGLQCKNTSGTAVTALYMNTSNQLIVGAGAGRVHFGTHGTTSRMQFFASERIDFCLNCSGTSDAVYPALSFVSEMIYDQHSGANSKTGHVLRPSGTATDTNLGKVDLPFCTIYYKTLTQVSDRNDKKDVKDIIDKYLELWNELSVKTFRYVNSDEKVRIGLIAQEVEDAALKVGLTIDECGFISKNWVENETYKGWKYGLDYLGISMISTAKLKIVSNTVDSHEERIKKLEDELALLKLSKETN